MFTKGPGPDRVDGRGEHRARRAVVMAAGWGCSVKIAVLVACAVVAVAMVPGEAVAYWGHGPRVYVGPPWPYYYVYPRPYYYVYERPTVIVPPEPVYVERPAAAPPPPPPPAPPAPAPTSSWYYCASAKAYYPTVPTCAEPWVKVPPRAP